MRRASEQEGCAQADPLRTPQGEQKRIGAGMLTGFPSVYATEIGGQRRAMALDVAFTIIGGTGAVGVLIGLVRTTLRARLRDDPFRFIYLWLLLVVCLILFIWGIVLGQPLTGSPVPAPNPFIGGTPVLP